MTIGMDVDHEEAELGRIVPSILRVGRHGCQLRVVGSGEPGRRQHVELGSTQMVVEEVVHVSGEHGLNLVPPDEVEQP